MIPRCCSLVVAALACLALLLAPAAAGEAPAPVPQTGAGAIGGYTLDPLEDGTLKAGVAWPNPRFTDNGNGTVTDNLTGLVWLKNAHAFGLMTWADALAANAGLGQGSAGLTDGSTAGHWHLANIKQLRSLLDRGQTVAPYLATGHPFSNVQSGPYWASTTYSSDTTKAWLMDLSTGDVVFEPKDGLAHFWPLRDLISALVPKSGQTTSYATGDDGDLEMGAPWPVPRFTDPGNGTVRDNLTGLIWLKQADYISTSGTTGTSLRWADALDFCQGLQSGQCGLSDGSTAGQWRMPNILELWSLCDFGRSVKALPSGHPFLSVQWRYWSSTTRHGGTGTAAWVVDMNSGELRAELKTQLGSESILAVRTSTQGVDAPVPATGAADMAGYTEDAREDAITKYGVAWPVPRFIDNNNGTVTDRLTRLIWLKRANDYGERTWSQAVNDCRTLANGQHGLTDGSTAGQWRLPSIRELYSIVCINYTDVALANTLGTAQWTEGQPFTSVQNYVYWSGTSNAWDSNRAWVLVSNFGSTQALPKTDPLCVWPVRSGP